MIIKDARKLKSGDKVIVKQYSQQFIIEKINHDLSNDRRLVFMTSTGRLFSHKDIDKVIK